MPTLDESRRRLRAIHPSFVDSVARVQIDPDNVPPTLRGHIPYAEVWGVADDWDREQLVERAPKAAKDDLVATVAAIDCELDDWLAGPASYQTPPSPEYVAFSAMLMAADLM